MHKTNQRLFFAIVGSGFIISASIIYAYSDPVTTPILANVPMLTWALGGVGILAIIFSWPIRRD